MFIWNMPAIVRGHCFQPLSFREQLSMFSIPFSSLTIDTFPMPVLFCTSFCDFRSRRFRLRSASSFPACFHLPAVCRLDLATPAGVGGPSVLRMDAISNTPASWCAHGNYTRMYSSVKLLWTWITEKKSRNTVNKGRLKGGPRRSRPPFYPGIFFSCKRVSDGTSSYVT